MKPFATLTRYQAIKFLIEARQDLCGLCVRPSAE